MNKNSPAVQRYEKQNFDKTWLLNCVQSSQAFCANAGYRSSFVADMESILEWKVDIIRKLKLNPAVTKSQVPPQNFLR
jgi:hypothetical protein